MNNKITEIKQLVMDYLAKTEASDEIKQYYSNTFKSIEDDLNALELIRCGLVKADLDRTERELTLKIQGLTIDLVLNSVLLKQEKEKQDEKNCD